MCLPPRGFGDSLLGGAGLQAVGWGKTNNGANISPVLNQLVVNLISNEECRYHRAELRKNIGSIELVSLLYSMNNF